MIYSLVICNCDSIGADPGGGGAGGGTLPSPGPGVVLPLRRGCWAAEAVAPRIRPRGDWRLPGVRGPALPSPSLWVRAGAAVQLQRSDCGYRVCWVGRRPAAPACGHCEVWKNGSQADRDGGQKAVIIGCL